MRLRRVLAILAATMVAVAECAAIEVWTASIMTPIFDGPDYSGRHDPKCTVLIVGARNGYFSGQVVLSSRTPLAGVRAKMSDLRRVDGSELIPASGVRIRYALPTGSQYDARKLFPGLKTVRRFEALSPVSPESATVQPVWITVGIPADVPAGTYSGTLSIVAGETISVPVVLKVSGWTAPAPADFTIHAGVMQSPDSVAMQYGVPLWSERHWQLLAQSMDLLGQLGNKVVFLTTICQTHIGNEQSMLRLIRQGDGTYRPDLSIMERYLDLYTKHVGKPDVVCLYAWDLFCGGGYFSQKEQKPEAVPVSVVEPDGRIGTVETPPYATPEAESLWKPVMAAIHQMLVRRGLGEKTITIGIAGDVRPSKEVVAFFRAVAPFARWLVHSHGFAAEIAGTRVGYISHVWGCGRAPQLPNTRWHGWNNPVLVTIFPREGGNNFPVSPPLWTNGHLGTYHTLAEICTIYNLRGFGRIGLDFWPVLDSKSGRSSILNRFPISGRWHQLSVSTATAMLVEPGPDGPLATVRFENLREGMYEAEARIAVERAVAANYPPAAAPAGRGVAATTQPVRTGARLPDDVAARLQGVLDERVNLLLAATRGKEAKGWQWFVQEVDWRGMREKLFAAAAEAVRLGGGAPGRAAQ